MTTTSPQRPVAHPPQIAATLYLSAMAVTEGWDVIDCGTREDGSAHIELQRLDWPKHGEPVFQDDAAAWKHVVARAREGSALHQRALRIVDHVERCLIAAECGWWGKGREQRRSR